MNFSINPLTFQSMKIETEHEQEKFLYQLGTLLSQMAGVISTQPNISTMTSSPWTAYTVTMTPGAGTITSQTSNCRFLQVGKLVFMDGSVQVTNIGTASGSMTLTGFLPSACKNTFSIACRELLVNGLVHCITVSTGTVNGTVTVGSTNANPTWANSFTLGFTCSYEAS